MKGFPTLASLQVLGDRHLRPTKSHHRLNPRPGPSRVRLTISPEAASTAAGQRCLGMAASLIARQFAIVHIMEIDVPEVPVLSGTQYLGSAEMLNVRIQEVASLSCAGKVEVCTLPDRDKPPVIDVIVGPGGMPSGNAELVIGTFGADWGAYLGPADQVPMVTASTENPVGPFFAACLAAGEVFRHLSGLHGKRVDWLVEPLFMSLWNLQQGDRWEGLPTGVWYPDLPLRPTYLVGAGAVGQALITCVIASGLPSSHFTIVDRDTVDLTNLNRYPLCVLEDVGQNKVDVLAKLLSQSGHSPIPFQGHWDEFLSHLPATGQRADLAALESECKFDLVLSCVDKNAARRGLQNSYPRILLGGSTLDFRVQVAMYGPTGTMECLKCHHPAEEVPLAPEALARELSGKTPQELAELADTRGISLQAIKAFLLEPVKCGMIVPDPLSELAGSPAGEMAVGFVSVAAGVLLFRDFWMVSNGHPVRSVGNNGYVFGFVPLKGQEFVRAKGSTCDCHGKGAQNYRRRWEKA